MRLTKYGKQTIILTREGDDTYSVYVFNVALKRRLADFAQKYPDFFSLESEDKKSGCQSYEIAKVRLLNRLTVPYIVKQGEKGEYSSKKIWFWDTYRW